MKIQPSVQEKKILLLEKKNKKTEEVPEYNNEGAT